MSNDTFQSGKWTGFYLQGGRQRRHRQQMSLSFADGVIRGCGQDDIGGFAIRGTLDSKLMELTWTKQYLGQHAVFYRGFRDGMRRAIWGVWEIGLLARGGLKIWPVGLGAEDGEAKTERRTNQSSALSGPSPFAPAKRSRPSG